VKALGEGKAKGIMDKISGGVGAKGLDMFRWMWYSNSRFSVWR
jgi:hypothetical protein